MAPPRSSFQARPPRAAASARETRSPNSAPIIVTPAKAARLQPLVAATFAARRTLRVRWRASARARRWSGVSGPVGTAAGVRGSGAMVILRRSEGWTSGEEPMGGYLERVSEGALLLSGSLLLPGAAEGTVRVASGSVVLRGGRIESVSEGRAPDRPDLGGPDCLICPA